MFLSKYVFEVIFTIGASSHDTNFQNSPDLGLSKLILLDLKSNWIQG